jgi:hypothetical protein
VSVGRVKTNKLTLTGDARATSGSGSDHECAEANTATLRDETSRDLILAYIKPFGADGAARMDEMFFGHCAEHQVKALSETEAWQWSNPTYKLVNQFLSFGSVATFDPHQIAMEQRAAEAETGLRARGVFWDVKLASHSRHTLRIWWYCQ